MEINYKENESEGESQFQERREVNESGRDKKTIKKILEPDFKKIIVFLVLICITSIFFCGTYKLLSFDIVDILSVFQAIYLGPILIFGIFGGILYHFLHYLFACLIINAIYNVEIVRNNTKRIFIYSMAIIIGVIVGVVSWQYFGNSSELEKNGNEIIKSSIEKETEKPETVEEKTDLSFKSSATKDWKTYRNTKYGYDGYEVKYPKDWFFEEKKDLVSFYNQNPTTYEFKRAREISPEVFNYPKEDFIFQINVIYNVVPELNLVQKKPITINKIDGIRGILIGGEGEKILTAHLIRTNKTFVFYGRPADSTFANFFDQIISTFKFSE